MTREPDATPELACRPDALPPELRSEHSERLRRLFGGIRRAPVRTPDGYEFTVDVAELRELAAFVALERRCCPFLSFGLEVVGREDEVRLRVEGPPGVHRGIEAEPVGRREGR